MHQKLKLQVMLLTKKHDFRKILGMSQNQQYIKSGVWYIVGSLLIKGISFFSLPLFTRLLSTSDFGNFNLFISYENIVNVIIGLGTAGTIKTAFFDYKSDFKKYFSSVLSLVIIFGFIVDIIVNIVFLLGHISWNSIWNRSLLNLLFVYSTASALYNIISADYVIEIKYKQNLAISLIYTVSSILLSTVLCVTFYSNSRYLGRIIGNAAPIIIITGVIAVRCLVTNKSVISFSYWKYALSMGIPLIFHSLSLVIMQQIDKIMVHSFCGSNANGIYSFACNISNILTIILGSLDNAWAPWFYSNLDAKNYKELRRNNKNIVAMFGVLCVIFSLLSPEMIKVLAPNSYREAIYSLIPLNISVFVNFMYMFSVNQEYYFKKTKFIASGTIISACIDIILNYMLIPSFGFFIAAYTTLVSKVVLFILHWIICRKIDPNRVVDLNSLVISLIVISSISFLSVILINNRILNIVRLTITAIVIFSTLFIAKKKGYIDYAKQLISKHKI